MNSARTGTFRLALLVAIASSVVNSHAWAQTTPNPVMPPATPQPAAEGGGAATDRAPGDVQRSLAFRLARSLTSRSH